MLKLCKVKGHSMSPSYLEGDYVLCLTSKRVHLDIGDCIIFNSNQLGFLIKQISDKNQEGFIVKGTHPQSTSSSTIGVIPPEQVVGKVVMRFPTTKLK
jgi:signal peptidase I